jgi:hypothetical protein
VVGRRLICSLKVLFGHPFLNIELKRGQISTQTKNANHISFKKTKLTYFLTKKKVTLSRKKTKAI